jgi:SAM-dependent methyltransferase
VKGQDIRNLSRVPPPTARKRWSQAQQAEFSFWARSAAVDDATRSRLMSVTTEIDFFDADGRFSKSLATARRVVEVGAGPAGIIYFLQTPALRIAVDPLTVQLVEAGHAKTFGAIRLQAVGEQLPFIDESVDVAICYNVLDHCRNPLAVIAEMHRIVRKGGTMVLALHLIRSAFRSMGPLLGRLDPPHPYHFTRQQALGLARSGGFRLELDRSEPKGWRRLALHDLVSYDGIRHLGSSIVTGSVGYFRFARD